MYLFRGHFGCSWDFFNFSFQGIHLMFLTFALRLVAGWHRQVAGSPHRQQQRDGQQYGHEEYRCYHHQRPLQAGPLVPTDEGDSLKRNSSIEIVFKVALSYWRDTDCKRKWYSPNLVAFLFF